MTSDFPPELQAEILTEFYSEADEHLSVIRDTLVELEASANRSEPPAAVVERLFRSFHTFKGICAIAGLKTAETLAHRAEDLVREVSKAPAASSGRVDLLMTITQNLEQIVRAHREKARGPDITALLRQLETSPQTSPLKPSASALRTNDTAAEIAADVEVARARGGVIWQCTFVPTPELDARGVNVNSIRARLTKVGEILRGTPEVRPGGKIAFEFVVSLKEALSDLEAWERDGVIFRPLERPEPHRESPRPPDLNAPAEHNPFVAPSHVVRVDLGRLDDLMRITGELVIHRSRLEEHLSRSARGSQELDGEELEEVSASIGRSLRDLRDGIMRVRLVPVAEIFSRMPFVVRDLARETQKKVRLSLSGQNTEIDKFLVERLKDPLLHLVRNAISHGVESAQDRLAAGKPEEATITLSAATVGDHVLLEIADDGRGVDAPRVAKRARELGHEVPEVLDPGALLDLLCLPGFSTREAADRGAGRGIGMAVVNNTIKELGGSLAMYSQPGNGTRFTLRLPLTLAIAEAFIVSSGDQVFAVPQTFVQEIVQLTPDEVHRVNRAEFLRYRDSLLPLFRLAALLRRSEADSLHGIVLVLSSERGSAGLVVDHVRGQREIVVRSMRDPLLKVPGVAGATELGDGKPVLILDATAVTGGVVRPHAVGTRAVAAPVTMTLAG